MDCSVDCVYTKRDLEREDDDLETVILLHLLYRRQKLNRIWRRMWVRRVFSRREQRGEYHTFLQEMRLTDSQSHFSYLRMSKPRFDDLLALVGPLLARRDNYWSKQRANITPAERLALTIRYLATGNSQVSISFSYRIGRSTICKIVRETCDALWKSLQPLYVKAPATEEEWKGVSDQFDRMWNFPHCVGAIDGKHITIQAPANSGSTYFNYKGSHSVILMAVCDALYHFILVDIGDVGRHSDGGVLSNSGFGQALKNGTIALPPKCPLAGTVLPYVIVGDEAFPLLKNLLRPYPGENLPESLSIF